MTFCCCKKRALRHKDADLAARNWPERTKIQHMWMGCSKPHLPPMIFSTQIQYWVLQCGGALPVMVLIPGPMTRAAPRAASPPAVGPAVVCPAAASPAAKDPSTVESCDTD